jgi:hypothetical protein
MGPDPEIFSRPRAEGRRSHTAALRGTGCLLATPLAHKKNAGRGVQDAQRAGRARARRLGSPFPPPSTLFHAISAQETNHPARRAAAPCRCW